jgi:hypothetical protein
VNVARMAARVSIVAVLVVTAIFLAPSSFVPHRLSAHASIGVQNMRRGFDRACAPSEGTMLNWWSNSPYYYVGIYIGGVNRSCRDNTNLTATWVRDVNTTGMNWSFIPLYVGLQDPCTPPSLGFSTFSTDSATAASQGTNDANLAINDAEGLGFTDSIIYFDLESWGGTGGSCLSSAEAFISAWDDQLQSKGWTAGVYGSGSGSAMDALYNTGDGPNAADLADYNDVNSPWGVSGVPNSDWEYDYRMHQYHADTSATTCNGGICLTVDKECAIGPTAKAWTFTTETSEPSGTSEGDGPSEDAPPCS